MPCMCFYDLKKYIVPIEILFYLCYSTSVINEITRISKPGRRVYIKSTEIPKVKSGRGIVLISTSKGIMTGSEAAKAKLGGELLLKVY